MNNETIVLEKSFDAPVSKVWKAITEKNEMKKWYFDLQEFKPVVGYTFDFTAGEAEGVQYKHLCEITEVINKKKLTYSWSYEGYPGMSYVTFELSADDDKTLLKLTHKGIESFAGNGPNFLRSSFLEGWTFILYTSLKNYLEKEN